MSGDISASELAGYVTIDSATQTDAEVVIRIKADRIVTDIRVRDPEGESLHSSKNDSMFERVIWTFGRQQKSRIRYVKITYTLRDGRSAEDTLYLE